MKFLAVHPSCLMYSKIYLRLEPLGLELVAAAAERAGHSVQLIDLQCESHQDFFRSVQRWRPDVIAFCGNYLANVPEIIDLARATRDLLPDAFICVGGHSVSFIPNEILRHADGAVDCVLTGEGETAITGLLDAIAQNRRDLKQVPGCVTLDHRSPPPASSSRSMICCPLAIWRDIAGNISSASSIRPLPLNSAEVARGTASFAAHGRSTDAITA